MAELRQDVAFETAVRSVEECCGVEHEEAGVDQMVGEHRLLAEVADPVLVVDIQRAVLRGKRYDGHRRGAAM